jgi:hypothetical protein
MAQHLTGSKAQQALAVLEISPARFHLSLLRLKLLLQPGQLLLKLRSKCCPCC